MEYKRIKKEELENLKVGDKVNFGDGEIREITDMSRLDYSGKDVLVDSIDELGVSKGFCKSVFVSATKESLSTEILKCQYCGALKDKKDMLQGNIISRNWANNNYKSPARNYCKGTTCYAHDQMAHEG